MEKETAAKYLKYCIIVLVVLTVFLFILSLYTLLIGLTGVTSEGSGMGINLDVDNSTGDWSLIISGNPVNNGVLGETLFIQVGILDLEGEYIARDSTSVYIGPGEQNPFSLTLTIEYEDVLKYGLSLDDGAPVLFEMKLGIGTLANLIGFTQTMTIEGEPET